MRKGKKRISKKEFVRGFGAEAIKYLESLPVSERAARIEAFGKKVIRSCGPGTESTIPTASETQATPLVARGRESH